MAQTISLLNASYPDVPAVLLPKSGGGTARFDDCSVVTASASDVASGKIFVASDGTITTGTASGGGSSNFTLLGTLALGTISTTSTTAVNTGKSLIVTGINDYEFLFAVCCLDTPTNNRHLCTVRTLWFTAGNNIYRKDGASYSNTTWNVKVSSAGVATARSSTSACGIYASGGGVESNNNGEVTITVYQRYNSTQTGTIDGNYTMRIYGVKMCDIIGL